MYLTSNNLYLLSNLFSNRRCLSKKNATVYVLIATEKTKYIGNIKHMELIILQLHMNT